MYTTQNFKTKKALKAVQVPCGIPMNRKYLLYIDQYGERIWAASRKELAERAGGGRISKMYRDKKDGSTVHVGYVVGKRWFTCYVPYEKFAKGIMRAI